MFSRLVEEKQLSTKRIKEEPVDKEPEAETTNTQMRPRKKKDGETGPQYPEGDFPSDSWFSETDTYFYPVRKIYFYYK